METIHAKPTVDHASAVETPSVIQETKSAVISKTVIKKRQDKNANTKQAQDKQTASEKKQVTHSSVSLDGVSGDYSEAAGETAFQELLAMNLLAEMLAAMPPKKAAKLRDLVQAIRQGKIKPSVVIADGKTSGTTLPKGVKGAYVAGANGQQGTIILAPGLTAKEQKAVLAEEFGEAIADRASQLGLRLAPGDAGARAVALLTGEKLMPATHAAMFQADRSDSGKVQLNGKEVTANFAGPKLPKRKTGVVPGSPGSVIAGPKSTRGSRRTMYARVEVKGADAVVVEMRDPTTKQWKVLAVNSLGSRDAKVSYVAVPVIRSRSGQVIEPELRVRNLSKQSQTVVSEDSRRVKKSIIPGRYYNYAFDVNHRIKNDGSSVGHSTEVKVTLSNDPLKGKAVTSVRKRVVPGRYTLTIDLGRRVEKEGYDHFEMFVDGKWKRMASRSPTAPYGFVPKRLVGIPYESASGAIPKMRLVTTFNGKKEIQTSPINSKAFQGQGMIQTSANTSQLTGVPGGKKFTANVTWFPNYHLAAFGARADKEPTASISLSLIPVIEETSSTSTPTRDHKPFASLSDSEAPDILGMADYKSSSDRMNPGVASRVLSYLRGGVSQKDFKLTGNGDKYIRRNDDGVTWSIKKNALSPVQRAAIVVGILRDTSLPMPVRRQMLQNIGISADDLKQLEKKFPKVGGGIDTNLLMGAYRFRGANFFNVGRGDSLISLNKGAIDAARAVKPLLDLDPSVISRLGLGPRFLDLVRKAQSGASGGFNHLITAVNAIVAAIGEKTAKFVKAAYARYAEVLNPSSPQHKSFMKDMKVLKAYAARFKGDRKLAAKQLEIDVRSGKVKFESKTLQRLRVNAYEGYDFFLGFILGFEVPGVKNALDAVKQIGQYITSQGAPDARVYRAPTAMDGWLTTKLDTSARVFITIPQKNTGSEGINYSIQIRVGEAFGGEIPGLPVEGREVTNPGTPRFGGVGAAVQDGFEVHLEMNSFQNRKPKEIKFVAEVEGAVALNSIQKELRDAGEVAGPGPVFVTNGRIAFSWVRDSEGKMDAVPDIFNIQGVLIEGFNLISGNGFLGGGGAKTQAMREVAAQFAGKPAKQFPVVNLTGFVGVAVYAGVDFGMTQDGQETIAVRGVAESKSDPTTPTPTPRPTPEPHLFGVLNDNMPAPKRPPTEGNRFLAGRR